MFRIASMRRGRWKYVPSQHACQIKVRSRVLHRAAHSMLAASRTWLRKPPSICAQRSSHPVEAVEGIASTLGEFVRLRFVGSSQVLCIMYSRVVLSGLFGGRLAMDRNQRKVMRRIPRQCALAAENLLALAEPMHAAGPSRGRGSHRS